MMVFILYTLFAVLLPDQLWQVKDGQPGLDHDCHIITLPHNIKVQKNCQSLQTKGYQDPAVLWCGFLKITTESLIISFAPTAD